MFNRIIIICVISFFIASCSHRHNEKVIAQKHGNKKITQPLYLTDITFSKEVADGKFKSDCAMLPILKTSILEASKTNTINTLPSGAVGIDQLELNVEYINVVPHKWRFMSVRPSSSATIKASILQNGVILHTTTKQIGSVVSFGACDRLEKISVAEGRYISKWLSKHM
jgi:hypothetical protein